MSSYVVAQVNANTPWQSVSTTDGSLATPRHEAHAVTVDGKIYLMGGRGQRPLEVYDPEQNRWDNLGSAPLELHHFQPVVLGRRIYAIASFTCCYPNEPSIADIHVFDTVTGEWSIEGQMPANRLRGAAAAVVWQGDIYILGGNTSGHNGGAVSWFDRYDPDSETWTTLTDAPHARDHFAAVIVDGQLVAAGGRTTQQPNPFANTVAPTNVYDFSTGTWRVGANIPTPRAGTVATGAGSEFIIAGGERNTQNESFDSTEAYNVNTNSWRALQPLSIARHSGGAALVGSTWHVIAGNTRRGGGAETSAHETLDLSIEQDLEQDTDNDGLTDIQETSEHNTNPNQSDTDSDGVSDGDEIEMGSNPLDEDSDNDGLSDGDETEWGTSLTNPDSDDDTLRDGDEVAAGTDPLSDDTDGDGLSDAIDPAPLTPANNSPNTVEVTEPVDPDDLTNPTTTDTNNPDSTQRPEQSSGENSNTITTADNDNEDTNNTADTSGLSQTENTSASGKLGGGALLWLLSILTVNVFIKRR